MSFLTDWILIRKSHKLNKDSKKHGAKLQIKDKIKQRGKKGRKSFTSPCIHYSNSNSQSAKS